jgi:hypothetical protein
MLKNPADPEILFDNGGIHSKPAGRLSEQIPSVYGRSGGNPIHLVPPE